MYEENLPNCRKLFQDLQKWLFKRTDDSRNRCENSNFENSRVAKTGLARSANDKIMSKFVFENAQGCLHVGDVTIRTWSQSATFFHRRRHSTNFEPINNNLSAGDVTVQTFSQSATSTRRVTPQCKLQPIKFAHLVQSFIIASWMTKTKNKIKGKMASL